MAKIISVINNKGGVGKSATVSSLAADLSLLGKKILVIDADPQGNSSMMMHHYRNTKLTIIDLFMLRGKELTKENVQAHIYHSPYENIDVIPCNEDFSLAIDQIFIDVSRSREQILKKALTLVSKDYDYILIDTSTYFNIITTNVLVVTDYVITPVENDGFSYAGLSMLLNRLEVSKEEFNPNIQFLGVFITKVHTNTSLYKNLKESYQAELRDSFIPVFVRNSVAVAESSTVFTPLPLYKKNSTASLDYKKLLAHLNILDNEAQDRLEHLIAEMERKVR